MIVDFRNDSLVGFNIMNNDDTLNNSASSTLARYIREPHGGGARLPRAEWIRFDTRVKMPSLGDCGWHFSTNLLNAYSGWIREKYDSKMTMSLYAGFIDLPPINNPHFTHTYNYTSKFSAEHRMYFGEINVGEMLRGLRQEKNTFSGSFLNVYHGVASDFHAIIDSHMRGYISYSNKASYYNYPQPADPYYTDKNDMTLGVYANFFDSLISRTIEWCYNNTTFPKTTDDYEEIIHRCHEESPDAIEDILRFYARNSDFINQSIADHPHSFAVNPETILSLMSAIIIDVAQMDGNNQSCDTYIQWARKNTLGESSVILGVYQWFEATLRAILMSAKYVEKTSLPGLKSQSRWPGFFVLEMLDKFSGDLYLHRYMASWLYASLDDALESTIDSLIHHLRPFSGADFLYSDLQLVFPELTMESLRDLYDNGFENYFHANKLMTRENYENASSTRIPNTFVSNH